MELRRNCQDRLSGAKSFIYDKSVANQIIEAWWSVLRESNTDWWMHFFNDLSETGHFDDGNVMHVECLRFCFMDLVHEELHNVAEPWNFRQIRPCNGDTPPREAGYFVFCTALRLVLSIINSIFAKMT